MNDLRPTERFSNRVDDYVRYRPSYPSELVQTLIERCHLGGHSMVADIGAGTGIFSRLIAPYVRTVFAVEPNDLMRRAASSHERIVVQKGTSEATGLPDGTIDLITAAQAFHWFEPKMTRTEFERILKPGGWVALLWNERSAKQSPFLEAYEALLRRSCPEYSASGHRNIGEARITKFMEPAPMMHFRFDYHQFLNLTEFQGRAMSSSYAPARNSEGADQFLTDLGLIFEDFQQAGSVAFAYETSLYLAQWNG